VIRFRKGDRKIDVMRPLLAKAARAGRSRVMAVGVVTGRGLQVHLIRPLMPDQPGSQLDSSLVIEAAGHLPTRFDVVAPLGPRRCDGSSASACCVKPTARGHCRERIATSRTALPSLTLTGNGEPGGR